MLRIQNNPRFYNFVQRIAGADAVRTWLAPRLALLTPGELLDVGAGTGIYADLIPKETRYVASDIDARKLALLSERLPSAQTVLADGTRLPFSNNSFDYAICIAVAHHLADIDKLLDELARVARTRVVLWEALRTPRIASRALWKIDRGSWPRARDEIVGTFGDHFQIEHASDHRVFHEYVLLEGRPMPS